MKITIGDDLEKFFHIRSQLPQQEKEELIQFLKQNIDVFAWNTYEAPGVDSEFICYHLNVNPLIAPQKAAPSATIQRACRSSPRGDSETQAGWGYQVVSEHGGGKEKKWEMASVP